CDGRCAELAARAARVFALLDGLGVEEAPAAPRARVGRRTGWLWPGVAAALAAGLAIASFTLRKPEAPAPPAVAARSPLPAETPAAVLPEAPVAGPVRARAAVSRTAPRRAAAHPAMDYFVALDDQPIESGVILRMAVQPGGAQADIIVDRQGRARAIRLAGTRQ
ncbi:MAG: hypothetical protein KGN36_12005, partial [Acidobacteriota bacterium]|nr:hypothetical protein [Acidobacteriota bacterium]